jgi:hypothetical protein
MLGAALGYDVADHESLYALQQSITVASRADRCGSRMMDYQIVDFSTPYAKGDGWSRSGAVLETGGAADKGGEQIYKEYWQDRSMTVLVGFLPESPVSPEACLQALQEPYFPVFLGRKACVPSESIDDGIIACDGGQYDALRMISLDPVSDPMISCWTRDGSHPSDKMPSYDMIQDIRIHHAQIMGGNRSVARFAVPASLFSSGCQSNDGSVLS